MPAVNTGVGDANSPQASKNFQTSALRTTKKRDAEDDGIQGLHAYRPSLLYQVYIHHNSRILGMPITWN